MKFIRTKDGRIIDTTKYERVEKTIVNGEETAIAYMYHSASGTNWVIEYLIRPCDILKQADTIEELCDELVMVGCYKLPPFCVPHDTTLDEIWGNYDKEATCYGAIWTDKGLIYVAKMNEKGELELL